MEALAEMAGAETAASAANWRTTRRDTFKTGEVYKAFIASFSQSELETDVCNIPFKVTQAVYLHLHLREQKVCRNHRLIGSCQVDQLVNASSLFPLWVTAKFSCQQRPQTGQPDRLNPLHGTFCTFYRCRNGTRRYVLG